MRCRTGKGRIQEKGQHGVVNLGPMSLPNCRRQRRMRDDCGRDFTLAFCRSPDIRPDRDRPQSRSHRWVTVAQKTYCESTRDEGLSTGE